MHIHGGGDLVCQLRDAHILHDDRIRACGGNLLQGLHRVAQLVIEYQRVEGDVAFYAAPVQGADYVRQFCQREAHFGAGAEVLQTEVNRVRTRFDGGL